MSIQDLVDAINDGSTLEEIKHLVDDFHIDLEEPVGELRLRAIHHAVYKGRADCVRVLFDHGCDINARDQCGYTPLHVAARYNRAEMANELISLGAHVDALDAVGCAPLHTALQKGHYNCADVLLQHGAETSTFYNGIGYEIHTLPGTFPNCLELLLSYGADPDARDTKGLTPLHHATRAGNTLSAYILLQNGADPDALTISNSPDLVGKTALQMAVYLCSKSIVELLLLYGADANCRDNNRNTPLHHAASRSKFEIAKLLIDNGAVLTARNALRYHPLHSACCAGAGSGIIELLLANGAFVNSTTTILDTPVKCVLGYYEQVLEETNSNGSDVNSDLDTEAKTRQRDEACVSQIMSLLDRNARITISNRKLDPFSVLEIMPHIAMLTQTRTLLLQASVDTRLHDSNGDIPTKFKATKYRDVFYAATNPVSLRQECRRVIRKDLGKTNLPEAVKELKLPTILQSYLTFRSS